MTATTTNRRTYPRLRLCYPIRVLSVADERDAVLGQMVTQNLCARGAYFRTFHGDAYRAGLRVAVAISVPHRLAGGAREVMLDLRARGEIVRVDGPQTHGAYGEDGLALAGIAVEFQSPLSFHYCWV